jgi:hypothetical protein
MAVRFLLGTTHPPDLFCPLVDLVTLIVVEVRMEVSLGSGETACAIALLPNEVALYVHYGLLPVIQPGVDAVAVHGFRFPLVFRKDHETGMGCLCLDPARALPWSAAQVRHEWPVLVIELREALIHARNAHGVSYSVGTSSSTA